MDIPSYLVKAGDVIAVKAEKADNAFFKALKEAPMRANMPKWVTFDRESLKGEVLALPTREDIDSRIKEHMIVELYSK